MPFAGKYTLAGKNYFLNEQRGEPDLDFAVEYLTNNIDQLKNKCVVLNSKESFALGNSLDCAITTSCLDCSSSKIAIFKFGFSFCEI